VSTCQHDMTCDRVVCLIEMKTNILYTFHFHSSKSTKYFAKQFTRPQDLTSKMLHIPACSPSPVNNNSSDHQDEGTLGGSAAAAPPARPSWRIKTQQEYIHSLSTSEIHKKGGLAKLEKQPTNRYFKRTKLADIIMLHGKVTSKEDRDQLELFVHFLLGILDPDPWKRWTAFQASQHPFITGGQSHRRRPDNSSVNNNNNNDETTTTTAGGGNNNFDIYWVPPWDPSICRRKLLNVQKTREKQQALRRGFGSRHGNDTDRIDIEAHDRLRRGSDNTTSTGMFEGNG
jgi:serine/threonine protein kinase